MSEHIIKTPQSHPGHPVVGRYFAATKFSRMCTEIYFCDSYDSDVDYFMTNVNDAGARRGVSVRAINQTWHEAIDKCDYWFLPGWGTRIQKADLVLPQA